MEFEWAIDITFLDEDSDQLIDVTECSIQRPKDSQMQEEFYSGKKKKNTQSKFRLSWTRVIEKYYLDLRLLN